MRRIAPSPVDASAVTTAQAMSAALQDKGGIDALYAKLGDARYDRGTVKINHSPLTRAAFSAAVAIDFYGSGDAEERHLLADGSEVRFDWEANEPTAGADAANEK